MAQSEQFLNLLTNARLTLTNAVNSIFGASGANHSVGLVPDPGASPSTVKFLREDASWVNPILSIPTFTSATPGNVPASGGGTTNFLRADGTFAVPPIPGATLINTLTAASATAALTDTTSFTGAFSAYELLFQNILPLTANTTLQLQVFTAAAFVTTAYLSTAWVVAATSGVLNDVTFIRLSQATVQVTGAGVSGQIRVFTPTDTAAIKIWTGQTGHRNTTNAVVNNITGEWDGGPSAITGFRVFFSAPALPANTIASGVIKVYGIN